MTLVRFDPLDSLFFRDGSPYQKEETSQSGTASMFPPAPPTLVGAIRAACARALGWKHGNWCENEEICEQLGNGEKLGKLHFRGPFLVRCKSPSNEAKGEGKKTEILFPAPANLMGKIDKPDDKPGNENDKPTVESPTLLSPSPFSNALDCDFGSARLPEVIANPRPEGAKLLYEKGWWITAKGLEQVLKGNPPKDNHLVHQSQLWSKEPRIGIARSDDSRTTKEGAMYSPSHIRLKKGVSIAMEVSGLSQKCADELTKQPQPVGGESRACWLHLCEHSLPFPELPEWNTAEETLHYTVTALTPVAVPNPPKPGEENYAGLPGCIVSACLPRPVIFGGWDSLKCRPLPLKPYLAPGSVLFLEAKSQDIEKGKALDNHTISGCNVIGDRTNWGFGIVAIGIWNDSHK